MINIALLFMLLLQAQATGVVRPQSGDDPIDLVVLSHHSKMIEDESHPSTSWDEFGNANHPTSLSPTSYRYRYNVKVQNTGTKAIKAVWWRYVFFTKTGQSSFDICSKEKISPGQSKKLDLGKQNLPGPPRSNMSARPLPIDDLKEAVVILCIEYKDGSVWKRP